MTDSKEVKRLKAVSKYLLFDLKKEIKQIVKLASVITEKPIALVTLIDKEEQIILACEGICLEKMPRAISFCNHAIHLNEVMVVEDASLDERFKNFPSVTGDLHVRFYASANLNSDENDKIGTLCVYDTKPNTLSDTQKEYLKILAVQVDHILELDKQLREVVENNKILSKIAWVHAHKLTGPLSSILSMIDLIKYDNYKFNPEYITLLEKASNQLDQEVKDIVTSTELN